MFGSMPDFDRLVAAAHERGLKVLLDLVACHTSIQHAWFRDHPEWYIWAEGDRPPNNWTSAFGGPAWSRYDDEHWYLHSFYPEQPDLDWRNPDVVAAMQEVVRFWVARGADGFRLDAIDRLAKDPELRDDPPSDEPFGLPAAGPRARARPALLPQRRVDRARRSAAIREAAGGRAADRRGLPAGRRHAPYLEHLDRSFVFELIQSPWEPRRLRAARRRRRGAARAAAAPGAAWALSNHDFGRFPTRFGRANERAAALMLLTLPGTATLYQGDEIGQGIGPGGDPPYDRVGRDVVPASDAVGRDAAAAASATRSRGSRWSTRRERNVADQRDDPARCCRFWRELIALRRDLGAGLPHARRAQPGVIALRARRHGWSRSTRATSRPLSRRAKSCSRRRPRVPARKLAPGDGVLLARESP